MQALGYRLTWSDGCDGRKVTVTPPAGRRLVFLGDLVDRGPNSPDVLRIAMNVTASQVGHCVEGNHEHKLKRWLEGRNVRIANGLRETIDQIEREGPQFRGSLQPFLERLHSYLWLDRGRLVVAHAGLKARLIGQNSKSATRFALFGDTSGQLDEFGLPVRSDWAARYDGSAAVVYGHTAVDEAQWVNDTICIDTGCVFGGKLTALRWPERTLVQVPARKVWFERLRPPRAPG